jgi:hypothetical protein
MGHYTLFTDDSYELTTSWSKSGIQINISNVDWRENPTEALSITLNPFDIEVLIEELQLYADACKSEIEKENSTNK